MRQRVDFQRVGRRLRDKAGLPKNFRPVPRATLFRVLAGVECQVDLYTLLASSHGSSAMTARYAHLADGALKRAASVADSIMDAGQDEAVISKIESCWDGWSILNASNCKKLHSHPLSGWQLSISRI